MDCIQINKAGMFQEQKSLLLSCINESAIILQIRFYSGFPYLLRNGVKKSTEPVKFAAKCLAHLLSISPGKKRKSNERECDVQKSIYFV